MKVSDMIVSMVYIKEIFLNTELTNFVLGNQYLKILKILRIEQLNLKFFKEDLGKNKTIDNVIQDGILLCKVELETTIENSETTSSSENKYYYWFSYDGVNKIISMNPLEHL